MGGAMATVTGAAGQIGHAPVSAAAVPSLVGG
jgi:hypothetical protein